MKFCYFMSLLFLLLSCSPQSGLYKEDPKLSKTEQKKKFIEHQNNIAEQRYGNALVELKDPKEINGIYYLSIVKSREFIGEEQTFSFRANHNLDSCMQYAHFRIDDKNVCYDTRYTGDVSDDPILPLLDSLHLCSFEKEHSTQHTMAGSLHSSNEHEHQHLMILQHYAKKERVDLKVLIQNDTLFVQAIEKDRYNYSPLRRMDKKQKKNRRTYKSEGLFSVPLAFVKLKQPQH